MTVWKRLKKKMQPGALERVFGFIRELFLLLHKGKKCDKRTVPAVTREKM